MNPIPGYPEYFADEEGNIYSKHKGVVYKKAKHVENGRNRVTLYVGGKKMTRSVGMLILQTFVPSKPIGMMGCHGEKGRLVDSVDNLYWGTHKRNMQDRARDGTDNRGERSGHAKLNNLQVRVIRHAHGDFGVQQNFLAIIFGVGQYQISRIITRKRWFHI